MPAAEFTCAVCGAVAGRVEVSPSPTGIPGRLRLSIAIFIPKWEEIPGADYARAAAAVEAGDARALWQGRSEWAPFYCPECDLSYCRDHWAMEMEFDEGFYDCTYGTCPRGHLRIVDD